MIPPLRQCANAMRETRPDLSPIALKSASWHIFTLEKMSTCASPICTHAPSTCSKHTHRSVPTMLVHSCAFPTCSIKANGGVQERDKLQRRNRKGTVKNSKEAIRKKLHRGINNTNIRWTNLLDIKCGAVCNVMTPLKSIYISWGAALVFVLSPPLFLLLTPIPFHVALWDLASLCKNFFLGQRMTDKN